MQAEAVAKINLIQKKVKLVHVHWFKQRPTEPIPGFVQLTIQLLYSHNFEGVHIVDNRMKVEKSVWKWMEILNDIIASKCTQPIIHSLEWHYHNWQTHAMPWYVHYTIKVLNSHWQNDASSPIMCSIFVDAVDDVGVDAMQSDAFPCASWMIAM